MNIFEFLDNLVKGIVGFALNLFYTTGLMLLKPLRGPAQLYRDHRNDDKSQISSLSYLTLSLLLAAAVSFLVNDVMAGTTGSIGAQGAAMVSSGRMPQNFGSYAAATLLTVLILAAALRLLATVARLKGPKRQRFLVTSEYLLGLTVFVPLLVSLPVVLTLDQIDGTEGLLIASSIALVAFGSWTIFVVGINLVANLTRSAALVGFTRSMARVHRTARRKGISFNEAHKQAMMRWTGIYRQQPDGKLALVWRNYVLAMLVYLALTLPALAAAGAAWGTIWVSNWLVSQQTPSPKLEIFHLRCDLASTPATVTATLWNRSSEPIADWRDWVSVELTSRDWFSEERLPWRIENPADPPPPVMAPNALVEADGMLILTAEARKLLESGSDFGCRAAADERVHESVTIRNNVVLPQPAAAEGPPPS